MPPVRLLATIVLLLLLAFLPRSAGAAETQKYCDDAADNVVVYIDRTTPYDELDKQALIDGTSRIFEALAGGARFSLRTIADSIATGQRLLDACIPFCPPKDFLGEMFDSSCPEGVMLNDHKLLRSELVRQLQSLLANFVELPHSEIVRTIARSASIEYRPGRPNRLFLFTDLIENSQYLPGKEFFSVANTKLLARIGTDDLVPDLAGASVRVFGVGRGGTPERRQLPQELLQKLTGFWKAYFTAAGATLTIQESLGVLD